MLEKSHQVCISN